jgi:RNA polymerase sigma factor (sigma-70 family)
MEALSHAVFEDGHAYSIEKVNNDFKEGTKGVVAFTYKGVSETLAYVPVSGTNWLLTYLIRESLISERISSISAEIIFRSVVQTSLAVLALLGIAVYIFAQTRKNARIEMERKSAETASRVKQEELEQRALDSERKRVVNAALDRLPEDQRLAVHLIYFEELSYQEAARVMKKNPKQVDNLLYRAKKSLRDMLGEEARELL